MSGHSKWSTIKRKKGALDSKRAKIFTRILKEISISIKEGGSADPDANPRLRLAINNAKGVNMPKDNIQRAINKASDKNNSANFSELTYEGYGPSGIAIFIECTTDNINRTVANVRLILSKNGGNLGTNGSLSFLFDRKGVFTIPRKNLSEEDFTMDMIDAGAEDVQTDEEFFTVYTTFENFSTLQKKLEQLKVEYESAEIQRIPKDTVVLDVESAKKVMKLIEALEDDDDVSAVYHNLELTEELIQFTDN
jgi:YebC/PmpR family DNA-binding regulatory protein